MNKQKAVSSALPVVTPDKKSSRKSAPSVFGQIIRAMESDDHDRKQSERLFIKSYRKAPQEDKAIINDVLVTICGYTARTLIKSSKTGRDIDDVAYEVRAPWRPMDGSISYKELTRLHERTSRKAVARAKALAKDYAATKGGAA